jgi:hypothetical protein
MMWSQSLPDTQNAREEIFSQEYENANVWGRLYATKKKFPSLGREYLRCRAVLLRSSLTFRECLLSYN